MKFFLLAVAAFLLSLPPLRADLPERNMANLQIDDQGTQLLMSWHFYYFLLPRQIVLHEMHDQPLSLEGGDPQVLQQNLTDIVLVAFEVKIDGRIIPPTLVKLTCYPNRSCLVLLSYPGHVHGNVELRAPVLRYFPPGYFLNVRVTSSTGRKGGLFGKNFPPVMHFVQGEAPPRPVQPFFSRDVASELGTAWVNYNWILTCIVLLLMQHPRQIGVLIVAIVIGWIGLCLASAVVGFKLPVRIPQVALSLSTVLLFVCLRYRSGGLLLTLGVIAAGFLNACYDLQQIPLAVPAQTIHALVGLSLGFIAGIALVLVVVLPLWWECRKFPGFRENWAPKISGALAALALFLPFQKWLFG